MTDWHVPSWLGYLPAASNWMKTALAARANGIPGKLIHSMPRFGLWRKWKVRAASRCNAPYAGYAQTDAAFARALTKLKLPHHDIFFGYSYASLEMLEHEKKRGVFTILDQIDPGPVHLRIVIEEMEKHPELGGVPPSFPETYFARVRQEWKLADLIVVNSEWTREAIVSEGADLAKIEVIPLAYKPPSKASAVNPPRPSSGPLQVLWLGQVAPAKGIYYLVEAARLLEHENVQFVVAGSLGIRQEFRTAAPRNIEWTGTIPRSETGRLYEQSDIFVLPTLSDGFALTQLEALAYGLPVIATPNCGRVVENGKTGFIVPPCDPKALADAILRFVQNRPLAQAMRRSCLDAVETFSVETLGNRLANVITSRSRKAQPAQ